MGLKSEQAQGINEDDKIDGLTANQSESSNTSIGASF